MAKIFAGIFVTIIPVLAILAAGRDGALGWLSQLVRLRDGGLDDVAIFWTDRASCPRSSTTRRPTSCS